MAGFNALPITEEDANDDDVQWEGTSKISGPRWAQLPLLTVGLLGVQVLWSVEMSYAPPYLVGLGLSRSWMSIVLLAGPLSGLIVQPLVGVMADNCKSRFGRRRPYMFVGALLSGVSMLLLGFTRDFASIFTSKGSVTNDRLTVALAVLSVYCIDFSINVVQAVDRALIVDSLPLSEQPSGNAWAARILGIGSVVGFFFGNVDLTVALSFFGETQLEILSVIAVFTLFASHGATAANVKEKVLVSSSRTAKGIRAEVRDIWDNILRLPRIIRQICVIQFLAWIAWYPILFLSTSYIGELYKRASPEPADDAEAAAQSRAATILGTRALFFFAVVTLFANFIMPVFVTGAPPARDDGDADGGHVRTREPLSILDRCRVMHLCELWAFSHLLVAVCMGATLFTSSVHGVTFLLTLTGFSWAITQWAPFSLLAEQILSDTSTADGYDDSASIHLLDVRSHTHSQGNDGTVVWDEHDERDRLMESGQNGTEADGDSHYHDEQGSRESFELVKSKPNESVEDDDDENERSQTLMGNSNARRSILDINLARGGDHAGDDADDRGVRGRNTAHDRERSISRPKPRGLQAKSGIILGIHNLFIVFPQILITGVSSLIFALLDPDKSALHAPLGNKLPNNGTALSAIGEALDTINATSSRLHLLMREDEAAAIATANAGPNALAIIFRIGGLTTAIAFVLCWRLARELKYAR